MLDLSPETEDLARRLGTGGRVAAAEPDRTSGRRDRFRSTRPVCALQRLPSIASGEGIDPRARLNLCDCAAYALAKTRNAPLLFKGDDFVYTDIVPAV